MGFAFKGRLAASYFADLFHVEVGGGAYAFLPYLLTAVAIGVILAAVGFTVLRAIEAAFLRRLTDMGADAPETAKTLTELGLAKGALRTRLLRRMLRDPACILYRNASSDALDRLKGAFSAEEASDTRSGDEEPFATADDAAHGTEGGSSGEAATRVPGAIPADGKVSDEGRAARESARQRKKMGLRLAVDDATRFYIPGERRAYVASRASVFSADDYMGLFYTVVAAGLLWFILLNLTEPLLRLIAK